MTIRSTLFIVLFALISGCAGHQTELGKEANKSVESVDNTFQQKSISVTIPNGTPRVQFDKQEYYLKWASVDTVTTNEYIRPGETIKTWTRMITFKEYAGTKELKDFLPNYMQAVSPLLALKPQFLHPKVKKHKDEMMLLLLLLAPDKSHYEHVVHRVYVDEGGPVQSLIFSLRIPFSSEVSFNEVMENRGKWMKELGELELSAFSAVPTP